MKRTYKDLRAQRLTPEQRARTCGYWFTVTDGGTAHTAFDTIEGLQRWASERGLILPQGLDKPGGGRIAGEYRTESHLVDDPAKVEEMRGLHTRTLSNGDYVVAVVTTDADGIRTVHTLNPNVRARKVYPHRQSDWIMGGLMTADENGHREAPPPQIAADVRSELRDTLSVYEQLKAAGVPLDSHSSDLYALATDEAWKIVKRSNRAGSVSTFVSQIDGRQWLDIPFAFDPWWAGFRGTYGDWLALPDSERREHEDGAAGLWWEERTAAK